MHNELSMHEPYCLSDLSEIKLGFYLLKSPFLPLRLEYLVKALPVDKLLHEHL